MKLLKKAVASLTALAAVLSLAIPLIVPVTASAQSVSSSNIGQAFCYTFKSNLGEGRPISAADANALTVALVNAGVWNSGTPITAFTDAVASAVTGFQEKYAAQILTPNGLSYGTGYVGASTRAELNSLYECSTTVPTNPASPVQCPAGYTCVPINPNPAPVCPTGWTCTPITSNPVSPANPITPKQPITTSCPDGELWNGSVCYTSPFPLYTTSLTPLSGPVGTLVNVVGGGFSASTVVTMHLTSGGTFLTITPTGVSLSQLAFVIPSSLTSGTYAVDITGPANSVESYFTVTGGGVSPVNTSAANVQLDGTTPVAGSVAVTNTTNGSYLSLPVMNFDVIAQGGTLHLHQVTVNVGNTGAGNVGAAYLYNGSVLIDSAAVANGMATFANIADGTYGATLPANSNVIFTIKVDVAGLMTGSSPAVITASVSGSGMTVYNAQDVAVPVNGSANGNTITVTNGSTVTTTSSSQPSISSITPSSAYPGNSIHLYGAGFGTGTTDTLSLSSIASNGQETNVGNVWQGQPTDGFDITFTLPQSTAPGNYDLYLGVPSLGGNSCSSPSCSSAIQVGAYAHIDFTVL